MDGPRQQLTAVIPRTCNKVVPGLDCSSRQGSQRPQSSQEQMCVVHGMDTHAHLCLLEV